MRPKFSLRALFAATLSIAAVLGAHRTLDWSWPDAIFGVAVIWVAVGLVHQARDIARRSHAHGALTSDQRTGYLLPVGWRLAGGAILCGYWLVPALEELGLLRVNFDDDDPSVKANYLMPFGRSFFIYECGRFVTLLVVLAAVSQACLQKQQSARLNVWKLTMGLLGSAAGALMALCYLGSLTLVPLLVYVAVSSIESSNPLWLARQDAPLNGNLRESIFIQRTFVACAAAIGAFWLATALLRNWRGPIALVAAILTAYLALVAIPIAYGIWVETQGLQMLSASFAVGHQWPSTFEISIVVLTIAATSTAMAVKVAATGSRFAKDPEIAEAFEAKKYYHQQRWLQWLLLISVVARIVDDAIYGYYPGSLAERILWPIVGLFGSSPSGLLDVALVYLCLLGLMQRRRQEKYEMLIVPVPATGFCVSWLALFVATLSGAWALAWLSYVVWLTAPARDLIVWLQAIVPQIGG